MATSGSVAFEPSITQCIEEAYERCQVQLTSGINLKTALFSLNILWVFCYLIRIYYKNFFLN